MRNITITNTIPQKESFQRRLDAINEDHIAWFSGWMSADGSIRIENDTVSIRFVICDKDPLVMFSELFGNAVGGPYPPSGLGKRDRYEWSIRGWKAARILERCLPWLSHRYADRARRGISVAPLHRPTRKLTLTQVAQIKHELMNGRHGVGCRLAKRYNITDGMVSAIKHGRSWRYVNAQYAEQELQEAQ